MPSKRHPAPDPPEPAEGAATGVTDPDPATVAETFAAMRDEADDIPYPRREPLYVHGEDAATAYAPGSVVPASLRPEVLDVAEGTATRSPNPLAGRHAYKVLQAIHHDGARVRPGEIVVLSPTSGLARSPFVRLIEDEPPPPEIAAALAEAEDG